MIALGIYVILMWLILGIIVAYTLSNKKGNIYWADEGSEKQAAIKSYKELFDNNYELLIKHCLRMWALVGGGIGTPVYIFFVLVIKASM